MSAAPAPIAMPLVSAPRSTLRTHSSDTGPGCAPTNRPSPKPTASELMWTPYGVERAGARALRGGRPTASRPPPSTRAPRTWARAWGGRAPPARSGGWPRARPRTACRGASARPAGSPAGRARGPWRWPRRARPGRRRGTCACRPRGRGKPRPRDLRASGGERHRAGAAPGSAQFHGEVAAIQDRERPRLGHADAGAGVVLVEIDLHARGVLVRAAPPEDQPPRRVDLLD